ncbi:TPA: hypothetical protein N0F65_013002 [Lagenidium giganteum]|uniref:Casein kinase substrate phosphoprotein PP28 domain-containing protein n=1 Tax=Lagenidium giganteum TaxID=4803 RepID=A0AAV2YNS7_9STRA|nr:TPA: hypothetical protein N0F65_013002 [Lagenidium giganteum]
MGKSVTAAADEDIAFETSAFDVVSRWLRPQAADAKNNTEERDEEDVVVRRPVQLYCPAKDGPASRGGGLLAQGKVLAEEEQEMKKKLLRKSGTYRTVAMADAEAEKEKQADELAAEAEEAELVKYKTTTLASTDSKAATDGGADKNTSQPEGPTKKRKASAQEILLEKLREEAARKKAKNQKAKARLQRKKEQQREAQAQAQAPAS